jgi:hypothetical protein
MFCLTACKFSIGRQDRLNSIIGPRENRALGPLPAQPLIGFAKIRFNLGPKTEHCGRPPLRYIAFDTTEPTSTRSARSFN